jgi:RNA polymerase sigma-70 factor (ECF subfamily)
MVPNEVIERQYQLYRKSRAPRDLAPVLEALAPKLLAAAARAGLDETGAEDAMQETFLGLISAEEKLDSERPIVPYVNGIALRQIKAEIRRRARLSQVHQPTKVEPQADELPETKQLERAELKDKLRRAVAKLSTANAAVVSAALFDGLSLKEISTKLSISESAAAVRLHRGLQRVRESLGSRASLSLLAMTIPRHQCVLPGILSGAGVTFMGVGPGVLVPLALLLMAGIWGVISLLQEEDDLSSLTGDELAPSSLAVSAEEEPAPNTGASGAATRTAIPVEDVASPADLAADETTVVTGTVRVDGSGVSPQGAEVFIVKTTPTIELPTEPMEPVAICDAQGRFDLSSDLFEGDRSPTVLVRAPGVVGYVDMTAGHHSAGQLPEIELKRELMITIDARDENGAPIQGAEISAVASSRRFIAPSGPTAIKYGYFFLDPYHHLYGAVTDETGRGIVHGIPGYGAKGIVLLFSVKAPGFAREGKLYKLKDGTDVHRTISLRRVEDLTLGGFVHNTEDQPIVGASIRLLARGEAKVSHEVVAHSDEAGHWSLPQEFLNDYPIFLKVEREGHCPTQFDVQGANELDGTSIDVLLRPSVLVHGRVVDGEGRGVPAATALVTTQHVSQAIECDDQGGFLLEGLTADPRGLLVSGELASGSLRSSFVGIGANATSIEVVLAMGTEADVVVLRQAEGAGWKRIELIPVDAGSERASRADAKIDGDEASFKGVRAGKWLAVGVTKDDVSCVQVIEFLGRKGATTVEISQEHHSGLKLWVDHGSSSPVHDTGEVGKLYARNAELHWLPDWLEGTQATPRSAFIAEFHAESDRQFDRLVPGSWDLFASGPGWSIGPKRVQLDPGAEAAPLLDLSPGGHVKVEAGAIHRRAALLFEARRNASEPWMMIADLTLGSGQETSSDLWMPAGAWSWRATLLAKSDEGERFQLLPSVTGEMTVDLAAPATLILWK